MIKTCGIVSLGILIFCLTLPQITEAGDDLAQKVLEAKADLKAGVNVFDADIIKKAKDKFLSLLMKEQSKKGYLHYYVGLCDYRLAVFYLTKDKFFSLCL